jgi:hypothetical protein
MSISVIGKDGTGIATVTNGVPVFTGDANDSPEGVGGIRMFSENDVGTYTGTPTLLSPETSSDYRLRVGLDTLLFNDTFPATTQNTSLWSYTFNTLTAAQPGTGTVNFSAVQGTTNAHGAFMRTFQYFGLVKTAPLALEFDSGQFTAALVTNEVFLIGFGLPTGATTPPTDGCWLQITSGGAVGVANYNGSAVQTGVMLPFGSLTVGDLSHWIIVCGKEEVQFWYEQEIVGTLAIPAANAQPFQSTSLPVFVMKYNTGNVSNTNTMRVADIAVTIQDLQTTKPWAHQMAIAGQSGYIGQDGQTQGKTSIWTNNTAPTAVALTNTAAAFVGLGGIAAVLPTLAANSDGIVFSFQNPAGTVNIPGRNLIITGAKMQGAVSVIFAGGPVIYAYALAFGHTAVSLATAETASFATGTTHAPRIVPIGIEAFPATAAVGTEGSGTATVSFQSPIVVRPGEFVQLIARNAGVVTTTGAITLVGMIDSYWE